MFERCTLRRRGRAAWWFVWSDEHHSFVQATKSQNFYRIFGIDSCKPIWIGRYVETTEGRWVWVTVENVLRAESIEFSDGGVYTFPK